MTAYAITENILSYSTKPGTKVKLAHPEIDLST
jgi:hypothetical protein